MKKKNVSKKKSYKIVNRRFSFNSYKGYTYILLLLVVFALLISLFASSIFYETGNPVTGILVNPTPYGKHESLQVHDLNLITVTPIPTDSGSGDIPCSAVEAAIAFVPPGGGPGPGGGNNPGNGGNNSGGNNNNSNAPLPPDNPGNNNNHNGSHSNPGNNNNHQPDSKPCPTYTPIPAQ